MKKVVFIVACLAAVQSFAQKIETEKWMQPRGLMYSFTITEGAKPYNGAYFKSFYYVPVTNKPLRLDVSTDGRMVYQVQVSNKKGLVFDNYIFRQDTTVLLPGSGTDTLNLYFIARVPPRGSVGMKYAIVDADTGTTLLSATPKKAFEQIINATQTNFTTLVPADKNRTTTYSFGKDGFAPLGASILENKFSQSIGTGFTGEQALADLKKWAKQLEGWLKPYGTIESKFYAADDLKKIGVIGVVQRQEIIKKNAGGLVLFRILLDTYQMEHYYNTMEITTY